MKKFKIASLALIAAIAGGQYMQAEEAKAADVENFKRSSIYTVLLVSDAQNQKIDKEATAESEGASLVRAFAGSRDKENVSYSQKVQEAFWNIPIPTQFNDHNLGARLVKFDDVLKKVTDDDKKFAEKFAPKKKSGGFGAMLGALAKESVGVSSDDPNSEVEENAIPVLANFIRNNNVADSLVSLWFDYGKTPDTPENWTWETIKARGKYALTDAKLQEAEKTGQATGIYRNTGRQLMENTYLIAFNLRFRSNQAIAAEASKVATGLFGSYGQIAGMVGGIAAGEGFQVQAKAYLFHLKWDKDIEKRFAADIFEKNATLEDLINSGLCELEYVGTEKQGSNVRQSITNKTPQSVLIQHATENAIDKAIAKLQVKFEAFRTAFPITEVDGNGNVYAKVGMKEGIEKGDEYEILEQQEDPKTGDLIWKPIGKVKAVQDQIWNNSAGAAEQLAEDQASDKKNDKLEKAAAAVNLGRTTFAGAKKGQDYTGYYLRLKKKK